MSKISHILNSLEGNSELKRIPVTLHLTKKQIIEYLQKETNEDLIEQWCRALINHVDGK